MRRLLIHQIGANSVGVVQPIIYLDLARTGFDNDLWRLVAELLSMPVDEFLRLFFVLSCADNENRLVRNGEGC